MKLERVSASQYIISIVFPKFTMVHQQFPVLETFFTYFLMTVESISCFDCFRVMATNFFAGSLQLFGTSQMLRHGSINLSLFLYSKTILMEKPINLDSSVICSLDNNLHISSSFGLDCIADERTSKCLTLLLTPIFISSVTFCLLLWQWILLLINNPHQSKHSYWMNNKEP